MTDESFEITDAGSSLTENIDTSRIKIGSLVMIKGFPCKVNFLKFVKNGKHGAAKLTLKGKDVFTQKLYECIYTSDKVEVPRLNRKEYNLLEIDGEGLFLMDKAGNTKSDINMPKDEHM